MIHCEGTIFESIGIIRYSDDPYKVIVEVDPEIAKYYRSLIPKSITLNKQKYDPHISVVRKEYPHNMNVWKKYDGLSIKFWYTNHIYSGTVYYWLNCFSKQLEDLRTELGLPFSTQYTIPPSDEWIKCFHITIANSKEHPLLS